MMEYGDVVMEIERLKSRKIELANRLNNTNDFGEKDEIKLEIQSIQQQIDTLDRFKTKA